MRSIYCAKHGFFCAQEHPVCPQCETVVRLQQDLNKRRAARGLPPFDLSPYRQGEERQPETANHPGKK